MQYNECTPNNLRSLRQDLDGLSNKIEDMTDDCRKREGKAEDLWRELEGYKAANAELRKILELKDKIIAELEQENDKLNKLPKWPPLPPSKRQPVHIDPPTINSD